MTTLETTSYRIEDARSPLWFGGRPSGWGEVVRGLRPEEGCSAAAMNSVEATKIDGTPRRSRSAMSCTLHDVQLPQSASASMTMSHWVEISCRRSTGAGLVKVGLR